MTVVQTKPLFIIGLGNPGKEYKNTRHNIGFALLDYIKDVLTTSTEIPQESNKKEYSLAKFLSKQIFLFKPLTFMNNSGKPLKNYLANSEIDCSEIIVVHDDLDIKLGNYKISKTKAPKVHNGLLSIDNQLGINNYTKVRIGVDNRGERRIKGSSYVLQKFTDDELLVIESLFATIFEEIKGLQFTE